MSIYDRGLINWRIGSFFTCDLCDVHRTLRYFMVLLSYLPCPNQNCEDFE